MIPAYGFMVVHTTQRRARVVAWDDDGHALVADHETARLVRAADTEDFAYLSEADPEHAVIPGGGWMLERVVPGGDVPGGRTITEPVIAWRIDPGDGFGVAVARGDDGAEVENLTFGYTRIWHPLATDTCVSADVTPSCALHEVRVECGQCPSAQPDVFTGADRHVSGSHLHDAVVVHRIDGEEHDRQSVAAGVRWIVDGGGANRVQVISP